MYMLYENKYISNLQGGGGVWGAILPEADEILKNQTKWRLFLYFFFAFWQGSLDPPNYELAPQLP